MYLFFRNRSISSTENKQLFDHKYNEYINSTVNTCRCICYTCICYTRIQLDLL